MLKIIFIIVDYLIDYIINSIHSLPDQQFKNKISFNVI